MIVPEYWAEGSAKGEVNGHSVTVRRFGWSDSSLDDAQAMADARAQEALARLQAGEKVAPREPKVPYNGAEGVPIREEVLSRHGDTVITRNIYGAHCLNTPDVLFVDIDFDTQPQLSNVLGTFAILTAVAVAIGWVFGSVCVSLVGVFLAVLFAFPVAQKWLKLRSNTRNVPDVVGGRVEQFVRDHPDWHLRLYRTPAGFRALAMHRAFDPLEPEVAECFDALKADPVYVRMCRNQRCFRARVSAKPWHIGIAAHIRPRPGVWPINPERLPDRNRWIAEYEQAAQGYAACRFHKAFGNGRVDPKAEAVRILHDRLSRADTDLPLG